MLFRSILIVKNRRAMNLTVNEGSFLLLYPILVVHHRRASKWLSLTFEIGYPLTNCKFLSWYFSS